MQKKLRRQNESLKRDLPIIYKEPIQVIKHEEFPFAFFNEKNLSKISKLSLKYHLNLHS